MAKTVTTPTTTTTPGRVPRVSKRVMQQADQDVSRLTHKGARAPAAPAAEEQPPALKPRTEKLIDGIRAPFRAHVAEFRRMDAKAAELAPPFMRAFAAYQADTGGASFISFVRTLDPSVPADRDGYRSNDTYRAADYLRRLVAPETGEVVEDPNRPAGMSEAFVRLLAAIVALIPGNQVERLWGIIGEELHWSERRVANLRTEVDEAQPLIDSHVERNALVVEER